MHAGQNDEGPAFDERVVRVQPLQAETHGRLGLLLDFPQGEGRLHLNHSTGIVKRLAQGRHGPGRNLLESRQGLRGGGSHLGTVMLQQGGDFRDDRLDLLLVDGQHIDRGPVASAGVVGLQIPHPGTQRLVIDHGVVVRLSWERGPGGFLSRAKPRAAADAA